MKNSMRVASVLWMLLGAGPAAAQEFGEFSPGPEGRFVPGEERPLFELTREFWFRDPNDLQWTVPSGIKVNGASIPQPFWSVIGGPFDGEYINASVVHDHFYRSRERGSDETHRTFYYGMRANGVAAWKAKLMYWAVATFAESWTAEKRIVQRTLCRAENGGIACTSTPSEETVTVTQAGVDLGNPVELAIALGKFAAVARTLKTTDGETLDITAFGNVEASLESIEENSARLRSVLATRDYERDPAALGVLSEWTAAPLDQIQTWEGGELPLFSEAPTFDDLTADAPAAGSEVFRLLPGQAEDLGESLELAPSTFEMPAVMQGLP